MGGHTTVKQTCLDTVTVEGFFFNIIWILMNTKNILCSITLLIAQNSTVRRTSKEKMKSLN